MNPTKTWAVALAALALMAAASAILLRSRNSQHLGVPGLRLVDVALADETGKQIAAQSILLPERPLDYQSELLPVTTEELQWLPKDTTYGRRLYRSGSDGFQIQVSGVLMGTDRTSIHKPEFCLPAQGFRILRRTQGTLSIAGPRPFELPYTRLDATREVRLANGSRATQGAVYVYWFVSGTRLSNDHFQRMWWLATDLIRTGELQRWAYLGVLGACNVGQEDLAFARLADFIRATVPEFQTTPGPASTTASRPTSSPEPALAASAPTTTAPSEGRR